MKLSTKQSPIGKPPADTPNIGKILTWGWQNKDLSCDELKKHASAGKPVCVATLHEGHRRSDKFISSGIIITDVDGIDEVAPDGTKTKRGLNDDELQTFLTHPFVQQYALLVRESSSSKPGAYRLHIFIRLSEELSSLDDYKLLVRYVMQRIPFCDPAAKDAVRAFWGGKVQEPLLYQPDNALNVVEMLPLAKASPERPHKPFITDRTGSSERVWQEDRARTERYRDLKVTVDDVREMLHRIPSKLEYHEWFSILVAIFSCFPDGTGIALAEEWTGHVSKPGEIAQKFASIRHYNFTVGTLIYYAQQYGYRLPKRLGDQLHASKYGEQRVPLPMVEPEGGLRHFPQGVPNPLREKLMNIHKCKTVRDQTNALVTYEIWTEGVRDGAWTDTATITAESLQAYANQKKWRLGKDVLYDGFQQLDALGLWKYTGTMTTKRGRPQKQYVAVPLRESLPILAVILVIRAKEYLHSEGVKTENKNRIIPILDLVRVEWFINNLDYDENRAYVRAIYENLKREKVYARQAETREKINLSLLKYHNELSLSLGYESLITAYSDQLDHSTQWHKPRDFRKRYYFIHAQRRDQKSQPISVESAAQEIGCTVQTLRSIRKSLHIFAEARYQRFPISDPEDILQKANDAAPWAAERTSGRWLEASDGTEYAIAAYSSTALQHFAHEKHRQGLKLEVVVQVASQERCLSPEAYAIASEARKLENEQKKRYYPRWKRPPPKQLNIFGEEEKKEIPPKHPKPKRPALPPLEDLTCGLTPTQRYIDRQLDLSSRDDLEVCSIELAGMPGEVHDFLANFTPTAPSHPYSSTWLGVKSPNKLDELPKSLQDYLDDCFRGPPRYIQLTLF